MSKKKSYMDNDNILSENFLKKLRNKIADKLVVRGMKKDKKIIMNHPNVQLCTMRAQRHKHSLPKAYKWRFACCRHTIHTCLTGQVFSGRAIFRERLLVLDEFQPDVGRRLQEDTIYF